MKVKMKEKSIWEKLQYGDTGLPWRRDVLYKSFLVSKVFYPTALKGCQGIVFTHGVRMGGWTGGRVGVGKKFVQAVTQKP